MKSMHQDLEAQLSQIELEIERSAASQASLFTSAFDLDSNHLVVSSAGQKNSPEVPNFLVYDWHKIGISEPHRLIGSANSPVDSSLGEVTNKTRFSAASAQLSPCGTFVLTGSGHNLSLFDAESSQHLQELRLKDAITHMLWEGPLASQASIITRGNTLVTIGWSIF